MVITTSIAVYFLHVSSQLEYFLFHLCNVHIVTVIQLSLQSLKNLGLETTIEKRKIRHKPTEPPSFQHLSLQLQWLQQCTGLQNSHAC